MVTCSKHNASMAELAPEASSGAATVETGAERADRGGGFVGGRADPPAEKSPAGAVPSPARYADGVSPEPLSAPASRASSSSTSTRAAGSAVAFFFPLFVRLVMVRQMAQG